MATSARVTTYARAALATVVLATAGAHAAEPMPPHESLRLASTVLHEARRLNVYLPPDYDARPDARYPVLYVLDGGEDEDFPHVAAAADRLMRVGAIRPFLVVGIANTVRRRDMTGPTDAPEDLRVTSTPGGAAAFRRFLAAEALPAVNARYRVDGRTAIVGESLAGLFIVDTLLAGTPAFDTYIAVDPSLWWNRRGAVRAAPRAFANLGERRTRLLLATGGAESNVADVDAFADVLRTAAPVGLAWRCEVHPGLRHDTIYRALEPQLLAAAFDAWRDDTGAPSCVVRPNDQLGGATP